MRGGTYSGQCVATGEWRDSGVAMFGVSRVITGEVVHVDGGYHVLGMPQSEGL